MTLIRGSSSPIFTAGCWINTFSASEKKKTTTQHSTKLLLKKQRAIKSQENERELRNTPRGNLTLGMEPIDTCGYYYSKIPHTFWNQHEIWFTHFLRLWITTGVWPGRQQNSVLEAGRHVGGYFYQTWARKYWVSCEIDLHFDHLLSWSLQWEEKQVVVFVQDMFFRSAVG